MSNQPDRKRTRHTIQTRGPIYTSQPMDRIVKTYPISEHELNHIADLSNSATVAFSAASAFASLSLGLYLDLIQESMPAASKNIVLMDRVTIGLAVVAVLCAAAGVWFLWRKGTHVKRIKNDVVEQRIP